MAETRADVRKQKPARRPLFLLLVAAVTAAVLVWVITARDDAPATDSGAKGEPTATTSADTPRQVKQFSGSGDLTTEPFQVANTWELRWSASAGSGFTIELLTQNGTSRGQIVIADQPSSKPIFINEVGEFTLKVTAEKPWTAQILSQPPGPTATPSPR